MGMEVLPKKKKKIKKQKQAFSSVHKHVVRGIHGELDNCRNLALTTAADICRATDSAKQLLVNQEENGEAAGVATVGGSSSQKENVS